MVTEESVTFGTEAATLEGRLAVIPSASHAVVICHPHPQYGGDMHNAVVTSVAGHLQRAGVTTLRFNFRGTGASSGHYDHGVGEADDARAAVALVRERSSARRIALAGYSFGAMVALKAGGDDASVDRLIAIAPPLAMFDASFLPVSAKLTLFLLGDRDQYCPWATLEKLCESMAGRGTARRLAGADHFLGGTQDLVGREIVAFVLQEQ